MLPPLFTLSFRQVPRNTTREQWYGMYRWKRTVERYVGVELGPKIPGLLRDLCIYGSVVIS